LRPVICFPAPPGHAIQQHPLHAPAGQASRWASAMSRLVHAR
jgi:hypothetical protein